MDESFFRDKFDWNVYIGKYKDLRDANIDTKQKAWKHAKGLQKYPLRKSLSAFAMSL